MSALPDQATAARRRRRSDNSSASIPTEAKRTKSSNSAASTMTAMPDPAGTSGFQPQIGAKRLVIQNLRKATSGRPKVEQYYITAREELSAALEAVFRGEKPAVPLERLYREVEDLCRSNNAPELYNTLSERFERHLQRTVLPRIVRAGGNSSQDTLRAVLKEWKEWNKQTILFRSTFSYLDRTYLLREKQTSINEMMITQFQRMAFPAKPEAYQISPGRKTITGICELIQFDRLGDNRKDSELMKHSMAMLYVLSVYIAHFEPQFLQESRAYFTDFAGSRSASSLKDYIMACERLLQREELRCIQFNLESTTRKQMMEALHTILIHDYTEKLLNAGALTELLQDKDVESMKALYDLLRLAGIEKRLKTPWSLYIASAVENIVKDKEHADDMVIRLLSLRRSLELMIRDAFAKDNDMWKSMRDSFSRTLNDNKIASVWDIGTSKVGEMLAKHIDMLLRGGIKALPKELLSSAQDRTLAEKEGQTSTADEDAELNRQLEQALELLRFISGKDTFEAFYKKDLARRLLMGRSASHDAERNMITKLRDECGHNLTHNLEQMFKDQELGKDEMTAYKEWKQSSAERDSPIELSVMVLSSAAWPTYPDVRLNLQDDVASQIERFDKYYQSKHTGRLLSWKHSLAHCSIRAKFPKGAKELLVSAFQASVLLMFNAVADGSFLTYDQIKVGTALQGGDLDRTLQSLACGKARVLSKHPKGREVNSTDTFTFNKTFTDPKFRVKINQIQLKETKEENTATHERVAQDRRFETQAAIVRIMKSRKTMGHSELVAEVITLMTKRGNVEPAAIKKEIEKLIEKDYIEREDGNYTYLA